VKILLTAEAIPTPPFCPIEGLIRPADQTMEITPSLRIKGIPHTTGDGLDGVSLLIFPRGLGKILLHPLCNPNYFFLFGFW
jgi:hypothetical protein